MVLAEGVNEPREARATAVDDSGPDLPPRFAVYSRRSYVRSVSARRGGSLGRSLRTTAYVVAACALLATPGVASARGTGGAQPSPTPAPAPVATPVVSPAPSLVPSSPASVAAALCASNCGGGGAVQPGSLLRVRGKTLTRADEVLFLGAAGDADDVAAPIV